MYYEINVSLNGTHLFATHKRSLTNRNEARKVLRLFLTKFPKDDGYSISISFHPEKSFAVGKIEDIENLTNEGIETIIDDITKI